MLEIYTVNSKPVFETDILAPDVFIDSIELNGEDGTVHFHLEDSPDTHNTFTRWLNNEKILNSLFVYIKINEQEIYKESLLSIKKSALINNYKLYKNVKFKIKTGINTSIEIYCGNESVVGNKIIQTLTSANKVKYNDDESFISKIKDLSLLDIKDTEYKKQDLPNYIPELLISYNPEKKAALGFIFNLKNYLYNNSDIFNHFYNYKIYNEKILSNSYIELEKSSFYKKIHNKKSLNFKKIENKVNKYTLNENGEFFVVCKDDNSDDLDRNIYDVKVKLKIFDYSYEFFNNTLKNLKDSRVFLEKYAHQIEQKIGDNYDLDKSIYFYKYNFETYKDQLPAIIENLVDLYCFYNNSSDKNSYYTIFSSILHPLTTRSSIVGLLLKKISILEAKFSKVLKKINFYEKNSYNKKSNYFEYEFNKDLTQKIDYNYDKNYGYEVISQDTKDIRNSISLSDFYVVSSDEKNYRKRLEAFKFYSNPQDTSIQNIEYFSISSIDLGDNSYYLLPQGISMQEIPYKQIFLDIKKYNNNIKTDKREGIYYYELLNNHINIKSLSVRDNGSSNELQRATLFDNNLETKRKSLEYILSTGIEKIYYLAEETEFMLPTKNISQALAINPGAPYGSNFVLTKEVLSDPELKPRCILIYDNFLKDTEKKKATNYTIYKLETVFLNEIFSKKLRLYNGFYILKNNDFSEIQKVEIIDKIDENLIKQYNEFNIPAKYLNMNNIIPGSFILNTDEIL